MPGGTRQGAAAPMLCWNQVREAAAAGVEIGAHSHSHPQLDQIGRSPLRDELATSRAMLEDGIGRAVPSMAYPFGYSSARVREEVRLSGYEYACAVANAVAGSAHHSFMLPRLTVRASTRQATFEQIVDGSGHSMIYLKDHALTKGFAMVRRSRAALGGLRGRA